MESIQKQLEDLGLTPNEVKVYLASLESGPATAQQIAAKAAVVRPTAYVAIGGLSKRGLMSSHTRGKKQYFQAERPARLLKLLEDEKKKIAAQESKLKTLLPGLESLLALTGERTEVKYFEGWDGLASMQDLLLKSAVKKFDVIRFGSVATHSSNKLPPEKTVSYGLKLKKLNIKVRQVLVCSAAFAKNWEPIVKNSNVTTKFLLGDGHRNSELTIFGDQATMITYLDVPQGCLLKSKEIIELLKLMFQSTWKESKHV